MKKLSFKNACIHFEALCRPESIFHKKNLDPELNLLNEDFLMPIEMNLRMVGAGGFSSIKSSFNVDFIVLAFKICTGVKISDDEVSETPRFITISRDIYPVDNNEIELIRVNQKKINSINNCVDIAFTNYEIEPIGGWISLKENIEVTADQLITQINEIPDCIEIKYKNNENYVKCDFFKDTIN